MRTILRLVSWFVATDSMLSYAMSFVGKEYGNETASCYFVAGKKYTVGFTRSLSDS